MKSKKYWYTLFEIMIVLVVIIILMTVTMRFSWSRIDDLQAQTSKDDLKNNYEELLLSNMSSNYHNEKRYTTLDIIFESWSHGFTYSIQDEWWNSWNYIGFIDEKQTITKISTENEDISKINIQLKPYTIWCTITNEEKYNEIIIRIQAKNKDHCFKITNSMCKGEYIPCL